MTVPTRSVEVPIAAHRAEYRQVSRSPFGSDDEIGMLNLVNAESMLMVLSEIDSGKAFDLAVDYFIGMPNWTLSGDPTFQIWMSHSPNGTLVDDATGMGQQRNELVAYSGDCMSLYTHSGTHVDSLNHMGYRGEVWNGFRASEKLGSRHWTVGGADKHPPIVARGVLIDVAAAQGVTVLAPSFGIGEKELREALDREGQEVRPGDVVLVRTGRMTLWPDAEKYIPNEPGLNRSGAEFLAKAGAILVGSDNIGIEQLPTAEPDNWQVVHTYMLAEAGVPLMEITNLEELSAEHVYQFAFIGACLRIRGATGSPIRPIAFPLRG